MDGILFKQFLKAAQADEKVSWHHEKSRPYKEIIDKIYYDVSTFKYYCLDGRFQDLLKNLLKNPKYETEGYSGLLKDLEFELEKMAVPNLILLPLNCIDSSLFEKDIKLNNNMEIFLPTELDLTQKDEYTLTKLQQKRQKDRKNKYTDNLCLYFEKILKCRLDKEHILLAKDKNFFNYPILAIQIYNVDYKVEQESGKIAESVYSILRMLDFQKENNMLDTWGIFGLDKNLYPANTYVLYYNDNFELQNDVEFGYYGNSFRFNFANILDVNTSNIIKSLDIFTQALDIYVNTCFFNIEEYTSSQLKIINNWNNAIIMFNKAYEFASTERYDACSLTICSLLESIFLKNEGRNKKQRLLNEIKMWFNDNDEIDKMEDILPAIESVYKYRNDIMHEGNVYETRYMSIRALSSYQGRYPGMRPFSYQGAVIPNEDILCIKKVLEFISNFLISQKTLDIIKQNLK